MITQKLVNEIHATEVMYSPGSTKKFYNAIVLADIEEGVSVKPLFKTHFEKNDLIFETMEICNCSYEEAVAKTEEPTFCLAHYTKYGDDDVIRSILKAGSVKGAGVFLIGVEPICPFA